MWYRLVLCYKRTYRCAKGIIFLSSEMSIFLKSVKRDIGPSVESRSIMELSSVLTRMQELPDRKSVV